MRPFILRALLGVFALIFGVNHAMRADWVAFNDHVPGTIGSQTHSNATTLRIPSTTNGPVSTNLVLRDISSGSNLPVTLTITRSGQNVFYTIAGASPVTGSPLYAAFNGFVYFGSGAASNVEITNSSVTYTFSGLNPNKRYSFVGGANRGAQVSTSSNKFTRVEIQDAVAFRDA